VRYVLLLFLLVIAGLSLWTWLTLSWAYSDGTRAGILQKFSHRGWLCKTQEGDLVLAQFPVAGVTPQIWQFSVRDPAVSAQLEKAVGARVQLHYTEHPGIPSACFADTRFFVDRVTVMDENPGGTGPGVAGSPSGAPIARPLAPAPPPAVPPVAAPPVNP